jgi:hypothetical protein
MLDQAVFERQVSILKEAEIDYSFGKLTVQIPGKS